MALHLETLGGREVQEDEAFCCEDIQNKVQAYFVLDGFGGEAVVQFVKRNYERVIKECQWDPQRTIN